MKIVSFYADGDAPEQLYDPARSARKARLGVVTAAGVLDVAVAARQHGVDELDLSTAGFFELGDTALPALRALVDRAGTDQMVGRLDDLDLAPTVPSPGKILCVGLNYRRHAAESGVAEPSEPILFSKFGNSLAAHRQEVPIADLEQVDYEAELGVVIGRAAKGVGEAEALGHVLGYLNGNDLSARRLQLRPGQQWLMGKTPDGFMPLGPQLLTADEVGDPQALRMRGWLNGELRQDSSTADMIFSVAEVIAHVSRHLTLLPGDVIFMGTPEGVILGREQKDWLKPGDEFTVEIGPLGRLSTRFV